MDMMKKQAPMPQGQPINSQQVQPPVEDSDVSEELQHLILSRIKRLEPGDAYALYDGFKSEEAIGVLATIVPEISPILAQILQFMSQEQGKQTEEHQEQEGAPLPQGGVEPQPQQVMAQEQIQEEPENPILRDGPTTASRGLLG